MEENTEQTKVAEKQANSFAKLKHFFSVLLKLCPIVLSLVAVLFSISPQIFFFHSNYIKKAEAGHVKSQIFLADYYYEVADISESIYWYKISAMHSGKHQARALNNLAVLYSRQEQEYPYELTHYKCLEVGIFRRAAECSGASEKQKLVAAKNMFYTLVSLPKSVFSNINYDEELDWVKKYLKERGVYSTDCSKYEDNWIELGTLTELELLEDDVEVYPYQVIIGTKIVTAENGNKFTQNIYETRYDIYRKKTEERIPDLEMIFDESY